MTITDLQKSLELVSKLDKDATVTSYHSDYIAIWLYRFMLKSELPDGIEEKMDDLGWMLSTTKNGLVDGWFSER